MDDSTAIGKRIVSRSTHTDITASISNNRIIATTPKDAVRPAFAFDRLTIGTS
ncbi:MAG: hypothetical protein ABSF99_09355 [Anaerolineales bacterium]